MKTKLMHLAFLFMRPMTLGVRVIAINRDHEVALVKHTYVEGWHLPGGGVDVGEDCMSAAKRELSEETGMDIADRKLELLGIYLNRKASRRDHVVVYTALDLDLEITRKPNREIAAASFFPIDALPDDTTQATRDRLAELFSGADKSVHW